MYSLPTTGPCKEQTCHLLHDARLADGTLKMALGKRLVTQHHRISCKPDLCMLHDLCSSWLSQTSSTMGHMSRCTRTVLSIMQELIVMLSVVTLELQGYWNCRAVGTVGLLELQGCWNYVSIGTAGLLEHAS